MFSASVGVGTRNLGPAHAILLVREIEGYYDEGEVVVDPFKLGKVAVREQLGAEHVTGAGRYVLAQERRGPGRRFGIDALG